MWECGSVVASGLINFNFEVLIFLFKFVLVKQIWVHVCCTGSFGNSKIAISKPLNYHGLIQHRLKVFCLNISCLCHVRWLLSLFHSYKMFFLLNWLFITIFAMPWLVITHLPIIKNKIVNATYYHRTIQQFYEIDSEEVLNILSLRPL